MSATIIAASAGAIVEQIGSYAGYASIIGLGILALLYFTQAREVKRLREWAGRAPERAAELEERVQADAQKRVVAQPIGPTSAAGQQAAEARTAAATAAVYASVGAQPPGAPSPPGSLARPTPPTPNPGAPAPGAVPPAPGAAAPGPPSLPASPTASAGTQTQTPTPSPTGRPMVTATPAPLPSPTATTPAAAAARAAADSRTLPAANGSTSQDTAESAAARPEPLPSPPSQFSDDDDDGGGGFGLSPARVGMIVGGAVAAVLVAVVLMVALTGEEDPAPSANSIGDTPAAEEPSDPADTPPDSGSGGSGSSSGLTAAERRATNVAVLNGTTQTGLARAVGNKILKDGFTIGGVDTNADQSVPATTIAYSADNRPAALAVAKIVGVDSGSVQAADANSTVAAEGDVVVIVGSDQIE